MTIEIADRLIKLRKKHGYSQEELADKLGLSRQAVSKWERAEASPDTDNLICLAKLYGVSLDELLDTEDDLDTIVKEQVKSDEGVEIDGDTIHLKDDEGNEVVIKDNKIECKTKDGKIVKRKDFCDKFINVTNIVEAALGLVAIVAYILLGSLLGMWHNGWIVFFIPEIICSIPRAIHKRNPFKFSFGFLVIFTYFFVCMVMPGMDANLWHPLWVIFLSIPIYHIVINVIRKAMGIKEIDD